MAWGVANMGRLPATFWVGLSMIGAWVLTALFAPWLAPTDPLDIAFDAMEQPPSAQHWFGTDHYGRDMFSRVLHGGLHVLAIAPAATLLGLVLGTAIGLVAAYLGGWRDEGLMRLMDAIMAFPLIVLALLALAALGPSTINVIVVIGLVFAPLIARTARAAALVEVEREYVQAARLRGESGLYILFGEVLPNIRGPLMVEAVIRVGYAVFTSATLGFLGLGVQPPAPDWGVMISENRALLTEAPWTVLFPAAAIGFVVVGFSLVADGLQEREA